MKRVLIGIGVVVLLLVLAAGGVAYSAFGHTSAIVDGQALVDGVQVVKDGFVSVVIVDGSPGKVFLIDAGNDKSGKHVLDALTARGLNASSVEAIFLTHGHPDHTAAAAMFPQAAIYAMKTELPLIGDKLKVTHPLEDGEKVKLGDTDVEAFAVPGHTPGSAAFLTRGVLFFGDSAGGGKDGTLLPAVRFFSKDPAQNIASLKGLEARLEPRKGEVKVLAFAHSGPLQGFGPLEAFAESH